MLFAFGCTVISSPATPMMPPTPVEETKPKPTRKRTRKPAANAKNKKTNASPAPANPAFPTNQMPGSVSHTVAIASNY